MNWIIVFPREWWIGVRISAEGLIAPVLVNTKKGEI